MKAFFRRSGMPTEADLNAIPPAKLAEFELREHEFIPARRSIYALNRDWMKTGVRYRTMREGSLLYVLKLDQ